MKPVLMENTNAKVADQKSPLDVDWSDVEQLARYVTGTGRILPRKYTGLSARQQRHITRMIKRARNMLLMK
ncbi:MAG: 30S ribosomal protein S18 [Puniceicoccales bacterium]|jgi:small subunit ribosomal protein S18|nr:30S ribosomal protein S18 [Puniceicoccales bacterium]